MQREPLAWVELHQGRYWLVVRGLYVAMEGDRLRDGDIVEHPEMPNLWSEKGLRQAADIINGKEELKR